MLQIVHDNIYKFNFTKQWIHAYLIISILYDVMIKMIWKINRLTIYFPHVIIVLSNEHRLLHLIKKALVFIFVSRILGEYIQNILIIFYCKKHG